MSAPTCQRCSGDRFISGAWPNLPDEPCPECNPGAPSGAERVKAHATRLRVPTNTTDNASRDAFAKVVLDALAEECPIDTFEMSATTSGCPLIVATFGGEQFNITITRARK